MSLAHTRILVTNDDGLGAEGILLLEEIARGLSDDVWVVAPEHEQSGAGHSLTMHEPIRLRQVDARHFAVRGTPTDCVLLAVMEIMTDKRPDLILSGVNRGSNLAEDVTYSGTIAAAMEGTLLEIPSIALSNAVQRNGEVNWEAAQHYAPALIRDLAALDWPPHTLLNLNFPGIPLDQVRGVKLCPQGRRRINEKLERRLDPRGRPYYWIAGPGTEPFSEEPNADYRQIAEGFVTVTPLDMDLTDYRFMAQLATHIGAAA